MGRLLPEDDLRKLFYIGGIFAVAILGGAVPVIAGVFMSASYMHLLPDAVEKLRSASVACGFEIAYFFAAVGFILIFFVEEVFACATGAAHNHGTCGLLPAASDAAAAAAVTGASLRGPLLPAWGSTGGAAVASTHCRRDQKGYGALLTTIGSDATRERQLSRKEHGHSHGRDGGGWSNDGGDGGGGDGGGGGPPTPTTSAEAEMGATGGGGSSSDGGGGGCESAGRSGGMAAFFRRAGFFTEGPPDLAASDSCGGGGSDSGIGVDSGNGGAYDGSSGGRPARNGGTNVATDGAIHDDGAEVAAADAPKTTTAAVDGTTAAAWAASTPAAPGASAAGGGLGGAATGTSRRSVLALLASGPTPEGHWHCHAGPLTPSHAHSGDRAELAADDEEHMTNVGYILSVALSFHSFMEGLGLGAASAANSGGTFVAILLHKGLAAASLGSVLYRGGITGGQYSAMMFSFALLTPLGAAAGLLVQQGFGSSVGAGICTALGAGTFVHVAASESFGILAALSPWV